MIEELSPADLHRVVVAALRAPIGHPDIDDALYGALVRIAERHAPWSPDGPHRARCPQCEGPENYYPTVTWPCDDFRDAAAAVGIEVPQ